MKIIRLDGFKSTVITTFLVRFYDIWCCYSEMRHGIKYFLCKKASVPLVIKSPLLNEIVSCGIYFNRTKTIDPEKLFFNPHERAFKGLPFYSVSTFIVKSFMAFFC